MQLSLLAQLALFATALSVGAAPVGYLHELVTRIELADITTTQAVGETGAKACIKFYCDTYVPGAQTAKIFGGIHKSPPGADADVDDHYNVALKDKNDEYINGYTPGTMTEAQAQEKGNAKEAKKKAYLKRKGKPYNPPAGGVAPPNPSRHHVDPSTNGPTQHQFDHLSAAGGHFPIPAPR